MQLYGSLGYHGHDYHTNNEPYGRMLYNGQSVLKLCLLFISEDLF